MTTTAAAQLLEAMPFAVASGVELDTAAPEEVTGRMAWAPERCTTLGVLHGGAVRDGSVHARSFPLHVGRTVIVVQTDLSDGRGKRVAQVVQTQAVLALAKPSVSG